MELKEYQEKAMTTCMDSCRNISYMLLNLTAEVGEFAGKVAKAIRQEKVTIRNNKLSPNWLFERSCVETFVEMDEELKKEAGDILWQLSGICSIMGWSLEDVAQTNLDKLASRKSRGVIAGNGDNR